MNLRSLLEIFPPIFIFGIFLVITPSFSQSIDVKFLQNIISATPARKINSSIYLFDKRHSILIAGQNYYGIKSLNSLDLNGHYLLNSKNLIDVKSSFLLFDQLFDTNIQLGYSRKLMPSLSAGFNFRYQQRQFLDYKKALYNMNISFILITSPRLILGLKINDLYPNITKSYRYIPSSVHLDIHYLINSNIISHFSLTKKTRYKLETTIGIYYRNQQFYFNLYVNPQIVTFSYSIGYLMDEIWNFRIGNNFHHQLGISTKTSVSYSF